MALPRTEAAPAFEADETEVVGDQVAETEIPAQAETATLPVAAPKPSMPTQVKRQVRINIAEAIAFSEIKDAIDLQTVAALSLSTVRLTAEQGQCVIDRTTEVGKTVVVEPVSWNHRWAVGTGSDDKEAEQYFRVSYDDETIHGTGEKISDYIDNLREIGYEKANKSAYIDLWAYLVSKGGVEIPADQRQIVLVQLSQTSAGNFSSFCLSRGLLEAQGRVPQCSQIELTAQSLANKSGKRYSNFTFKAV